MLKIEDVIMEAHAALILYLFLQKATVLPADYVKVVFECRAVCPEPPLTPVRLLLLLYFKAKPSQRLLTF